MLTHKSLEGLMRVAAQKKVDGLPNEDEFVVRRLNYQRSELLGLQEAYGSDPTYKEEVQSIAVEISRIDDALRAYPVATFTVVSSQIEGKSDMELLDVYRLACRLHTGQVDKAGRPYIEHLTRVLLRVQAAGGDLFQQMAALLHDVIEDRKASAEQLLWLGVPAEVVEMVKVLSKDVNQGYEEYLTVVKRHPRVLPVKQGDLDDNSDPVRLAALPEALAKRLKKKYDGAKLFLAAA